MNGQQVQLKVTWANQIQPKRQKWLYAPNGEGVIPLQTGTVFAGIGGEGKSSFAIYLAALLSRGELEGDLYGYKGRTIIFGPEDPWETAMVPRLMAAGADRSRIAKITAETLTPYGTQERELKFPLDIIGLEQEVIEHKVKLIVVDPISTSMTGDMNKVQDVRLALGALHGLAEKHDLAVISINHFNKSGTSIASKMSGSHALRDTVRSYLAFGTDEETGERIMTQDKSNYSTSSGSWKFILQNNVIEIPGEDKPAEVPSVRMLGASDVTVKDLIDREYGEPEEDRKDWESWLIEVLTEAGGSMAVKELQEAAAKAGFSFKTMQNGRSKVRNPRVGKGRNGFGKGSVPFWEIVEEDAMDPVHIPASESPGSMGSMGSMAGKGRINPIHPIDPVHPGMESHKGSTSNSSCPEHGTNYHVSTCNTCLELAKESA